MPEEQNPPPRLTQQVRDQTFAYITTALGLVAGLAWNEAVQGLITYLLPTRANSVIAKFIYAIAMTVVVIVLTQYLKRFFRKS